MLVNQRYSIDLSRYLNTISAFSVQFDLVHVFLAMTLILYLYLYCNVLQGNKAIVVDEPGVTRDRLYGRSFWGDFEFMVVDTGGVLTVSKSQANVMEELAISTTIGMDGIPLASREAAVARMPSMIEKQATAAVDESSVIIFLVDGQVKLLINTCWTMCSVLLVSAICFG